MDIFDFLTMIGGLCLFLLGMNLMGDSLERAAGNTLRGLLSKLTSNRLLGFLTGLAVTAVIQSSSATTVMVVGFVNSGLMNLSQAIGVIMGANIGTTVTAWILSLGGIQGDNLLLQLLKPTSFTPILALIGIIFQMFAKSGKKKDIGMVLLGFAVLMFGMDTMSGSVAGLKNEAWFTDMFLMFKNPILGVLSGAVLTGIIQSSSASVGILQALSSTGAVSIAATIPIIMGQNIGTTVTAMLSSVGTNKNAHRAAVLHTMFNIIGTLLLLPVFWIIKDVIKPGFLDFSADYLSISVCHTVFNVICTVILFPCAGLLEKLVIKLVPNSATPEEKTELDERLLATPPIALERCRVVTVEMASIAVRSLKASIGTLTKYDKAIAESVREDENLTDHYEDTLSTYLVKLSSSGVNEEDSREAARILKLIGDFERISDHAVNILESAEELHEKNITLSKHAVADLKILTDATEEILNLAMCAFENSDFDAAASVEPLEQIIDVLKEGLRVRHILRMQKGECSIEAGFIWGDLLTNLERTSDHCSNIAGSLIDMKHGNMNMHEALGMIRRDDAVYRKKFSEYESKYALEVK